MVNIPLKFCSSYTFQKYYVIPKYSVGQTLYRCDLANQGLLEKVTIKEVLLNVRPYPSVAIYKDTFNSLNMESDLCSYIDAVNLYNQYLQNKETLCEQRILHRLCRGLV